MSQSPPLMIPVSLGELADKLSILSIKRVRITDAAALKNVEREHAVLLDLWKRAAPDSHELSALQGALQAVNQALWQIEDDIRGHEHRGDFGPEFVKLARAVYLSNDERAAIKRKINQQFNSDIVEEKFYGR